MYIFYFNRSCQEGEDVVCLAVIATTMHYKSEWCNTHNQFHGVNTCICFPPFALLPFPTKNENTRREWIKRVNRSQEWAPNKDSRICSMHFKHFNMETKTTTADYPYPTQEMGYELTPVQSKPKRKPPGTRMFSPPSKMSKLFAQKVDDLTVVMRHEATSSRNSIISYTHQKAECGNDCGNAKKSECSQCLVSQKKIEDLQCEVNFWKRLYYKKQETGAQKKFGLDILKDDAKVKSYTGLQSKEVFDGLFTSFGDSVKKIRHWKGPSKTVSHLKRSKKFQPTRNTILTAKDELFLTLFRTRTMLKAEVVGDLFGISTTAVSRICTTWWKFLAKELKPLIYNPTEEAHKALLPTSFDNDQCRDVRHIVDCTEIFTETPKNKTVQAAMWSNYKHHNTAKFLISITPNGLINYCSKTYGGRASDRQIIENCGFLEEVKPGEKVMADRGFQIQDLVTLRQADVIVPPGRRGAPQMPQRDVVNTKTVANRRIRVEQVIRRIKCFNILKQEIPITLLHILDDIVIVCSALCNLLSPISRK